MDLFSDEAAMTCIMGCLWEKLICMATVSLKRSISIEPNPPPQKK